MEVSGASKFVADEHIINQLRWMFLSCSSPRPRGNSKRTDRVAAWYPCDTHLRLELVESGGKAQLVARGDSRDRRRQFDTSGSSWWNRQQHFSPPRHQSRTQRHRLYLSGN